MSVPFSISPLLLQLALVVHKLAFAVVALVFGNPRYMCLMVRGCAWMFAGCCCVMWCLGVAVALPFLIFAYDLQLSWVNVFYVFELRIKMDLVSAMFDNSDI